MGEKKKITKIINMNVLYVTGGIALLTFGIWQTIRELRIFAKGKQDKLGADIKILGSGIMFIMIGVYLIVKYL
ncbi:MAG TPA: hypothetical protein VGN20_07895 [Mucilaginibacter sp.]